MTELHAATVRVGNFGFASITDNPLTDSQRLSAARGGRRRTAVEGAVRSEDLFFVDGDAMYPALSGGG